MRNIDCVPSLGILAVARKSAKPRCLRAKFEIRRGEWTCNGVSLTKAAVVKRVLHLFFLTAASSRSHTPVRSRRDLLSLEVLPPH